MSEILRLLGIYICIPIYTSIPKLYDIFYYLANARFFGDDSETIKQISSNLYVLISVVMLFVFSATLLSAIVNPDMILDKSKGIWALVKRSFFGILLIVIIPFTFKEAYSIQNQVMEKGLIEKVLVGISFNSQDSTGTTKRGGNGGQVIAGRLISSVLYPAAEDLSATSINPNLSETYEKMVTTDIERIRGIAPDINAVPSDNNSEVDYVFEFQGLVAIIAGAVTLYILLLFAIDTAVRIFQLALYELTAPISIIAFIAKGKSALIRWAKQVGSVYLDVFVRIAAMAFYILMISQWDNLFTNFKNVSSPESWELLFRVILIVGLLIFIKKLPDYINKAFGTNISLGNGIGGRLGQMAIVGKTAQSAWNEIRQHPIQSVGRPVGAAAATIGGIGSSVAGAWSRSNRARGLEEGSVNARAIGAGVAGLFGGLLRTPGSMRRGWNTHNLTSFGNEIARNRDTHPEGSTLGGRISDIVTQTLGLGTALDRENIRIARENRLYLDVPTFNADGTIRKDSQGNTITERRFFTDAQLKEKQEQDNFVKDTSSNLQEAAKKELHRKDSIYLQNREFIYKQTLYDEHGNVLKDATGKEITRDHKFTFNNFDEAEKMVSSLRESGPQEENFYTREVEVPVMEKYIDPTGVERERQKIENGVAVTEMKKIKCKPTDVGAVFNEVEWWDAQKEYQNKINSFEKQIKEAEKTALKDLVGMALTGGDQNDWKIFNTKGDSSNYQTATYDAQVLNRTLSNNEYAPTVEQRTIATYEELEKVNTQAEKASNEINRVITENSSRKSTEYASERYKQAERDNQAYDAGQKNDHKTHSTGRDANNNFR